MAGRQNSDTVYKTQPPPLDMTMKRGSDDMYTFSTLDFTNVSITISAGILFYIFIHSEFITRTFFIFRRTLRTDTKPSSNLLVYLHHFPMKVHQIIYIYITK